MKATFGLLRRMWKAEAFSPPGLIMRAATLAALYAVSCMAGLQEYTTFLSGTSPSVNLSWRTAATLGLIHLLLHFAFILPVPILLIAAGLLAAWNGWNPQREIPDNGGHGAPFKPDK
jgi:hypothetical protein